MKTHLVPSWTVDVLGDILLTMMGTDGRISGMAKCVADWGERAGRVNGFLLPNKIPSTLGTILILILVITR